MARPPAGQLAELAHERQQGMGKDWPDARDRAKQAVAGAMRSSAATASAMAWSISRISALRLAIRRAAMRLSTPCTVRKALGRCAVSSTAHSAASASRS